MSTQEQRERFEVWFIAEQMSGSLYSSDEDDAWMAWKAAEAAAIERCASMVEVYLADHGIEQARECLPDAIRALLPKEES